MPRSKFQPGEDQRETVLLMAGHGIDEAAIAKVMKITPAALRKHFPKELSAARAIANSKVAETAYRLATSGKAPAVTMFWLKSRAGWRDRADPADGEDGAPPVPDPPGFDLSKLSDAELDQLEKLLEKARPGGAVKPDADAPGDSLGADAADPPDPGKNSKPKTPPQSSMKGE